jgi:hypothetical protein
MACTICLSCYKCSKHINGQYCNYKGCYIEYENKPKCGIMNGEKFFLEVKKMRDLQKSYYKTRDKNVLKQSIEQETLIDNEIQRVSEIVYNKK